jgi:putative endonuclease
MHSYFVYILTNIKRDVMYIGVTNDLERRIADHGDGRGGSFTRKYRLNTLVHVEEFQYIDEAIAREKEIKGWRRSKKNALVETANPTWADLADPGAAKGPSLRSG